MTRPMNIKGKIIDLDEVCEVHHRERSGNNEKFNEIVFVFKRGMRSTVQYETAKECFLILAELHGYLQTWDIKEPDQEET